MAFSMNDGGDDSPMADINVTPLVDVMLVLLIVFMITMPVLTHSIPLELPTTSNQKPEDKKDIKPTTIAVDKDGMYAVGTESDTKIDLEALQLNLKQMAKDNPEMILAIAADKEVAYDHVAQLLDAAREAGLSKVGFVTQVESGK